MWLWRHNFDQILQKCYYLKYILLMENWPNRSQTFGNLITHLMNSVSEVEISNCGVIPVEINQKIRIMSPTLSKFDEIWHSGYIPWEKHVFQISVQNLLRFLRYRHLVPGPFWAKILSAAKLSRLFSIRFAQNFKKFTSKLHENLYLTIFWCEEFKNHIKTVIKLCLYSEFCN